MLTQSFAKSRFGDWNNSELRVGQVGRTATHSRKNFPSSAQRKLRKYLKGKSRWNSNRLCSDHGKTPVTTKRNAFPPEKRGGGEGAFGNAGVRLSVQRV